MDTNKFLNSKALQWTIVVVAQLALMVLIFRAGMAVGFAKANFNFSWGENYHRLFGGPEVGWMQGGPGGRMMGGQGGKFVATFQRDDFFAGHNVVGTVIGVSTSTIIVKDANNTEKSLIVTPLTTIRRGKEVIQTADIKENDQIVGLGSPSTTGQIEIKFIRVFQP